MPLTQTQALSQQSKPLILSSSFEMNEGYILFTMKNSTQFLLMNVLPFTSVMTRNAHAHVMPRAMGANNVSPRSRSALNSCPDRRHGGPSSACAACRTALNLNLQYPLRNAFWLPARSYMHSQGTPPSA